MSCEYFLRILGRTSEQGGVMVVVVLLAQTLFRRCLTPRWCCALWLLVAARLLLPFSLGSAVSLFNFSPRWDSSRNFFPRLEPAIGLRDGPAPSLSAAPAASAPLPRAPWPWPTVLAGLWLAGTLGLGGQVLISVVRYRRRLAHATPVIDPRTLSVLRECARGLDVRRLPRLAASDAVASPVLHGLFRPQLLLPGNFARSFSEQELRFVLLHEVAHLKRGDLPTNWLFTALQVVHWFNPLVWFGFARWRADREAACDALALEAAGAGENLAYGRALLRLLESVPGRARAGLVGILEDKRQIQRRISLIASYRPRARWSVAAIVLLAGLAAVGLTDARVGSPRDGPALPDPLVLLRGVEGAREAIPPSSLKIHFTYRDRQVDNRADYAVAFDGEHRRFLGVPTVDSGPRAAFDGIRTYSFDGGVMFAEQVEIADLKHDDPNLLFDPRLLGLDPFFFRSSTLETALPYRQATRVENMGRESVDGQAAWHVRMLVPSKAPNPPFPVDLWIDDRHDFRVYRYVRNGATTLSYYDSGTGSSLPNRVATTFLDSGGGTRQSECDLFAAESGASWPASTWTLQGLDLPAGTAVVDLMKSRRVGYWDGAQVVSQFVPHSREYELQKIAGYTRYLDAHPRDGSALFDRALGHDQLGQADAAVADYSAVIRSDADLSHWMEGPAKGRALALSYRGKIYQDHFRDYAKALADYAEALRLDPTTYHVHYYRALIYAGLKEYDRAQSDFDAACQGDPDWMNPYGGWAWQLATCPDAKFRDGAKAVALARKSNDLSHGAVPEYLDVLAAALAENGRFGDAVAAEHGALAALGSKKPRLQLLMAARLASYESGRPWRDETNPGLGFGI